MGAPSGRRVEVASFAHAARLSGFAPGASVHQGDPAAPCRPRESTVRVRRISTRAGLGRLARGLLGVALGVMTTRIIGGGVGALLLAACGLGVDGLGPDPVEDAGSRTLEPVDSSVASPVRPPAAPAVDAAGAAIDASSAAPDPVVAEDASGGRLEGGTACVLPQGAALCCGSVACADGDGTCATAGVCALCQASCTNAKKPVCCAESSTKVSCQAKPDDC